MILILTLEPSDGKWLTYLYNKYIYSNVDEIENIIFYANILGVLQRRCNTLHYAVSLVCVTFLDVSLVDYANTSNHDQNLI